MRFTSIPDWDKKKLRCHFCGSEKSVKYVAEIHDPVVGDKETSVCVCNRCALRQL